MKIPFEKNRLLLVGIALFINFGAAAMDKPGVNPLMKVSDFLRDTRDKKSIDYSQLSLLDIERIITEVDGLLDPNQVAVRLRASQALQITPYNTWEYLQAIKRDLTEVARVRRMFYELLSKKNRGVAIGYEKISLKDLFKLQNEADILLRPGYDALLIAAGRRALVEPARVLEYLNAIKKDLSIAIEERIEVEHKSVQKRIVPISL